ncbi:hypothetical protein GF354_05415 [Candidatus Peregrinibacteria bacterium]|nr:hypothetical protein [Candidatus Peregrinibacteria bacterium]
MFWKSRKAWKIIEKAQNVAIISHRKPDADTLGSAIAFWKFFKNRGVKAKMVCKDKPNLVFNFLPYVSEFITDFNPAEHDLIIFVDIGASYMTHLHISHKNLFTAAPTINIDHHSSNDHFADINIVDSTKASATQIIFEIFRQHNVDIDEDIATCLLAGIYGDTGSFKHANTSEQVFKMASYLMAKGGQIKGVTNNLFKNKSLKTLKLWGRVLEKTKITPDKMVLSVINEEDYDSASAGPEHLSGVVEYLNMVPDSKFAILINEDRKGNIKGSFRTRNREMDLSRMAATFGGGGHKQASGFILPGQVDSSRVYPVIYTNDGEHKQVRF